MSLLSIVVVAVLSSSSCRRLSSGRFVAASLGAADDRLARISSTRQPTGHATHARTRPIRQSPIRFSATIRSHNHRSINQSINLPVCSSQSFRSTSSQARRAIGLREGRSIPSSWWPNNLRTCCQQLDQAEGMVDHRCELEAQCGRRTEKRLDKSYSPHTRAASSALRRHTVLSSGPAGTRQLVVV